MSNDNHQSDGPEQAHAEQQAVRHSGPEGVIDFRPPRRANRSQESQVSTEAQQDETPPAFDAAEAEFAANLDATMEYAYGLYELTQEQIDHARLIRDELEERQFELETELSLIKDEIDQLRFAHRVNRWTGGFTLVIMLLSAGLLGLWISNGALFEQFTQLVGLRNR